MTIYGDWYDGNPYHTNLTPNEQRGCDHIKQIEQKIREMRSLLHEFVVVELNNENGDPDTPEYFQTTIDREYNTSINERYNYCVELGVREADGIRIFSKSKLDCDQVVILFYDICVDRKGYNPKEWKRGNTVFGQKNEEAHSKDKEFKERYEAIMSLHFNGKIGGALGDAIALEACEELSNLDSFYDYSSILVALYEGNNLYRNIQTLFEQCSYDPTIANSMGDIAYYGKLGQPDPHKAYDLYEHAAHIGSLRAQYNLARSFKDGLIRPADPKKYEEAVRSVYDFYIDNNAQYALPAITDIILELSEIEEQHGNTEKALEYCLLAKKNEEVATQSGQEPTETTAKIMQQLFSLTEFDPSNMELFDLFYALKRPCVIRISLENKIIFLEVVRYEDEVIVKCGEKYYRNALDFFKKFRFKGKLLTAYFDEIDYIILEETK